MKVDIQHLAGLARLRFTPEEITRFEQEMQTIVDMVSTLPEIEGETSLLDTANPMVLRTDEVAPSMRREELLANAPAIKAGCIVVPKTIE